MKFTEQQLDDYAAFEEVRKSGQFNMFDPRAILASGLSKKEYDFVKKNYSAIEAAHKKLEDTSND